jgi:Peptidase C39 family
MAISVDLPIEHLREPVVSCDTALLCLLRVGVGNREDPEFEEFRHRAVLNGNTLPASRLIELVGKLGLQAECMRLDWNGLTGADLRHPILVFLKNTNAVVVTGMESPGAEAVSVWDPLHGEGEVLTVRREDFERAWSGDALAIAGPPSGAAVAISGSSGEQNIEVLEMPLEAGSEQAPMAETELPPEPISVAERPKSRRLVAIGILAAAAFIVLFWLHAVTNNVGITRIRPMEQSSEVPQVTAEAAAHSMVTVGATNALTGPMPATAPSVAAPPSESPGAPTAAAEPMTAAPIPESAATITGPAPVMAGSPPAGPLPPVTPIVPMPPLSASPGEPAAAAALATAAIARESAPAVNGPASTEPPAGPAITAEPVGVIPRPDVAAPAPSTDPPSSAGPRLPGAEIAALVARGDVLFSTGDLTAARTFYERAADVGAAAAALRLGETYDPTFLDHAHLRGMRGDVETARSWYRRARDLGAAEAEILLNSLQAQ